MTVDINMFYLNTPLNRYEYVWLILEDVPEEISTEYNLQQKATPNGYVYLDICKGMYGLPQEGFLEQNLLDKIL